jgi:hypothetical protein
MHGQVHLRRRTVAPRTCGSQCAVPRRSRRPIAGRVGRTLGSVRSPHLAEATSYVQHADIGRDTRLGHEAEQLLGPAGTQISRADLWTQHR